MRVMETAKLIKILRAYPGLYVDVNDIKEVFRRYADIWSVNNQNELKRITENSLTDYLLTVLDKEDNINGHD